MSRTSTLVISISLACISMALPIAASIYLADTTAERRNKEESSAFALKEAEHAEIIDLQARDALAATMAISAPTCSNEDIANMGLIKYQYRFIEDIGRYSDSSFLCSAILGKSIRRDGHWTTLREHPGANGIRFWLAHRGTDGALPDELLLGLEGVFVTIDPLSYVDLVDPAGRAVAVIHAATGELIAVTPGVDAQEMLSAWRKDGKANDDRWQYTTARKSENHLDIVVRFPKSHFEEFRNRLLSIWISFGITTGAIMGWLIFRWSSKQLSFSLRLERAISRSELTVAYQPIISLLSGQCVGVEALVRWSPSGIALSPEIFIPIAESHGLIQKITDFVLKRALLDLSEIFQHHPSFYVSINVSSQDLLTNNFLETLKKKTDELKIHSNQIRIEATERGTVGDKARQMLELLRQSGHPIYIDDFGTGYSSLSYLQKLKVDVLKIDKSFVDTITMEAASSIVAPHIISMAHELNLEMVAEGVESHAQESYLREHGVQYAQGWLYGKPMSIDMLKDYLTHPSKNTSLHDRSNTV